MMKLWTKGASLALALGLLLVGCTRAIGGQAGLGEGDTVVAEADLLCTLKMIK